MVTLRHSMTNCRFGAAPTTVDRTLADASTMRSSQNAYTVALGCAAAGIAVLLSSKVPGSTRLTLPLVSIHALL
jgi:hypothetical protein